MKDSTSRDPLTPTLSPASGGEGVVLHPLPLAGEGRGEGRREWPKALRRGPMEMLACVVITIGIVMMLQPFLMSLFTWSFLTTLFGTLMFMIVSKLPE